MSTSGTNISANMALKPTRFRFAPAGGLALRWATYDKLFGGFMKLKTVIFGLFTIASLPANATILTFDTTSTQLGTYGDNVSAPGVGYSEGLGFTPNVSLNFLPDAPYGQYSIWSSGYASLTNALGHGSFNVPGEIVFTPDSGYSVLLHRFDMATWSSGTYQTDIRIWDANGSRAAPNLFSFNQQLNPNIVYQPLAQSLEATGPLHLYISNLGSTGIDNISISQVPVPPAIWMFGSGILGLLGLLKKQQS